MLQAASKGDNETFEELFREFYRPVFGIFRRLGCSPEDSEDLASETFRRAFGAFSTFRGDAQPLTWLHTIAANVWRNQLRDASAAKRDGIEVPIPDDGQAGSALRERAHDQGLRAERRRLLKAAIDKLSPKKRRCVWLRVYQDMSYAEIAELLDTTEGTAKSHFSLAKRHLKSLLAEHYPELDADLGD